MLNLRHFDLKIRLHKEEKDKFKHRMSGIHKSSYITFTRNNYGQDNRATYFDYSKRGNIEHHLRRQAEIYATSAGEGSIGAGALDEGAVVEGVGVGRIKDTRLGAYFFASKKNSFISSGCRA
jgi:hypothetical protein